MKNILVTILYSFLIAGASYADLRVGAYATRYVNLNSGWRTCIATRTVTGLVSQSKNVSFSVRIKWVEDSQHDPDEMIHGALYDTSNDEKYVKAATDAEYCKLFGTTNGGSAQIEPFVLPMMKNQVIQTCHLTLPNGFEYWYGDVPFGVVKIVEVDPSTNTDNYEVLLQFKK